MIERFDKPNLLPWPPMILGAAIVMIWLLGPNFPLLAVPPLAKPFGTTLVLLALAIDITAMVTMARAHTTILPNKGTDNLVTHGIFAFSRNPIYVANVLIIIGLGLWNGTLWGIILAPLAAFGMLKLAIEREEAHLMARFGQAFAAYCSKTRRWL